MSRLSKLAVLVTGDASGAVKATRATDAEIKRLGVSSEAVREKIVGITASVAKWGAVAAGAAAAGAAVLIRQQMGLIDQTAKTADKLGIATDKLEGLRLQAELTGVAQNTLDMALQRMVRRLAEAEQGTGQAVGALDALGLSAQELGRLSPDQQFGAIADAMERVEKQGDRVRLAFKLFDAEGVGLVNTLRGGSAATAEAMEFTERWGLALSRVDAAKVEQAGDAMGLLSKITGGFWKQLTVQVSPALTGISTELLGLAAEYIDVGKISTAVFDGMITGAGFVADVWRGLHVILKGIAAFSAEAWAQSFEVIARADSQLTALLNKLPAWLGGGGREDSTVIQNAAAAMRTTADTLATELGDLVTEAMPSDKLKAKLKEWEAAAEESALAAASSAKDVTSAYDELGGSVDKVADAEAKRLASVKQTIESLTFQNQLTEREIQAVRAGDRALAQFNREKHIELALRSSNAKDMLPAELAEYRKLVEQQYELGEALRGANAETKALAAEATPFAQVWDETSRRMGETLTQMWADFIDGGRSAMDMVRGLFRDFLANMAHLAITRPIMVAMGLAAPMGASAGVGGGGAAGGLSALGSALSLGNLLKGGGALTGLNGSLAMMHGYLQSGLQAIPGFGTQMAGMHATAFGNMATGPGGLAGGAAMSAVAGFAGSWFGGKVAEELFGKKAESSWGAIAGSIGGSILGGPIGALIGGAIGGAIDVALGGDGKKRAFLGVQTGPLPGGMSDVAGMSMTAQSGLVLNAVSKRAGQQGADVADALVEAFAATDAALLGIYETLTGVRANLSGQQLDGRSPLAGTDGIGNFFGSAEFNRLVEEDITGATDAFVRAWVSKVNEVTGQALDLEPLFALQQEGEILADTLIRLNSQFGGVNSVLETLGLRLLDVDVAGIKAADALVAAVGGQDAFAQSADFFYREFYSERERGRMMAEQFSEMIRRINGEMGTSINSRGGLRDFVEALDLSTQAGADAYAMAMQLAPAIVGLEQAMGDAVWNTEALALAVSDMFADSYQRIFLDGLKGEQERYDYFKAQADAIADSIQTLTDPEAIRAAAAQYNQLLGQAYGSLSGDSQDQMRGDFLATIEAMSQFTQDLLAVAPANLAEEEAAAMDLRRSMAELAEQQRLAEIQRQETDAALRAGLADMAASLQASVQGFGSFVTQLPGNINLSVTLPEVGGS